MALDNDDSDSIMTPTRARDHLIYKPENCAIGDLALANEHLGCFASHCQLSGQRLLAGNTTAPHWVRARIAAQRVLDHAMNYLEIKMSYSLHGRSALANLISFPKELPT